MGLGSRRRDVELAASLEKTPQQGGAFIAAHTAEYIDSMRQFRLSRQINDAAAGTRLLIPGAEYHPRHACVEDGAHAPHAGLGGAVQRGPFESVIAPPLRAGAQSDDFGMSGRVLVENGPIPPLSDHLLVQYQHGTHGHLVGVRRTLRQIECEAHEVNIPGRTHANLHSNAYRRRTYRITKIAAYSRNKAAAL